MNEAASAAIRSANWPINSLQARATAAGSVDVIDACNAATLRVALCDPTAGTMSQLARIEACDATMVNSKISTSIPNALPGFGSRG